MQRRILPKLRNKKRSLCCGVTNIFMYCVYMFKYRTYLGNVFGDFYILKNV